MEIQVTFNNKRQVGVQSDAIAEIYLDLDNGVRWRGTPEELSAILPKEEEGEGKKGKGKKAVAKPTNAAKAEDDEIAVEEEDGDEDA